MLFAVRMDVTLPADLDPEVRADTLARERAHSQDLQLAGEWVHNGRCVGQYSHLGIFDVRGNERLHEILWNLPLFPHLEIDVTPLAQHPSDIATAAA
ncbi:muconolactone Delta-isomerase [Knoellia sp. p5-6-4]|uniref:muconolactone Delta-isomerase n=1 Tax=unclassified Knoellia TaxID=2618719 RepID=UPI0023DCD797|nr:muconolactone Delta-isomerase family protein [Knoellia sp. p5-6-4]MDF2144459.1 muconolactone Delta-isomerase family protein [Knoellia sp. p5-6-4]